MLAKGNVESEVSKQHLEASDDDDADQRAKKARKREKIENDVAGEVDHDKPPPETAQSVHYRRSGRKRRGQFILKSSFVKENPGVEVSEKDVHKFPDLDDPNGTAELEYVKIYRDANKERFDFSEEEGDTAEHRRVVDDGRMQLSTDQVSMAAASAAKTLFDLAGTTQYSATDVATYTGIGGGGGSQKRLPSPSPQSERGLSAWPRDSGTEAEEQASESDDDADQAPLAQQLKTSMDDKASPSKKTLTEVSQLEEAQRVMQELLDMGADDDPKEWESYIADQAGAVRKASFLIIFALVDLVCGVFAKSIGVPLLQWVV